MPNQHFENSNLDEELEEEMERYLWFSELFKDEETFEKIPRRNYSRDEN